MRRALSIAILLSLAVTPLAAEGAGPTTAPAGPPQTQPVSKEFAAPPGGWPKDAKTGRIDHVTVDGLTDERAWFHLAVPPAYTPDKVWPLMIVLHGGPGGKGPDEIVSFFRAGLTAKGVINVYPQALGQRLLEWNYPHEGAYLLAIIRQVARSYRIDPCRIYLAGVSMGGSGTWSNGAVMPQVWAGLGPMAGWYGAMPTPPPDGLKGMAIYCLHGEKDSNTPAERSRLAVEAMKKIGQKVRGLANLDDLKTPSDATMIYREVPGAEHNPLLPWATQGAPELGRMMAWLLAHARSTPADLSAAEQSLAAWGKQFGWTPGGVVGHYPQPTSAPNRPAAPASAAE